VTVDRKMVKTPAHEEIFIEAAPETTKPKRPNDITNCV